MNDWRHFPNAIADTKTKNESFLELSYTYRAMGVKHWYMILALHNPEIQGLDPHDPTLTLEQKAACDLEAVTNPWYFLREVSRVPIDGADAVPFKIHRGTACVVWCFFNNIDVGLVIIRQKGKTIILATLMVLFCKILIKSRTIFITKDAKLRVETLILMKQIRDELPGYMWVKSRDDADNTEIFTYVERGNRIITAIAHSSIVSALKAARGMVAARLLADEVAYIKNGAIMLPAALGAGTTARVIAEANGIPYGNIFATTTGKRDDPDGAYAYKLFHDGYQWTELLYDVPSRMELLLLIDKNSKGMRILIHAAFTHSQLGMTDEELYLAIANAGGTKEEIARDYGLKWTSGSSGSPIDVEDSERINASKMYPLHIEMFENSYTVNWYYTEEEKPIRMRKKHIIGLDTSDAIGIDNISGVMIAEDTLETAATFIVNESNLTTFSIYLADIMIRYKETILVIERKSSAPGIIDSLLLILEEAGIDAARRIFNRVIQDRGDGDKDIAEFNWGRQYHGNAFYDRYRKHFGFMTTGASRKLLYGTVLITAVKVAGHLIRDRGLASELLGLVIVNGRMDHANGGHDDSVIAWLLAMWFIMHGNRLEYYGVSNLSHRRIFASGGTDFNADEFTGDEKRQLEIIKNIDRLLLDLSVIRDPYMRPRVERRLRRLLDIVQINTSDATSISELKNRIFKNKKHRKLLR